MTRAQFLWRPGEGFCGDALIRTRQAFTCPREPMGEAWFIGKQRHLYSNLFGDLDALSLKDILDALRENGCGPCCFGERDEWRDWYHYLLPRLIPRSHETYVAALLEVLIAAFMAHHPDGLEREPYAGFRRDALDTLGQCLMDEVCWTANGLDVFTCLNKYRVEAVGLSFWFDASAKLSASLFFCLKYLLPEEIEPWMRSAISISNPVWRAQIIAWLVGAHGMLSGRWSQPFDLEGSRPHVTWEGSYWLKGNYTGRQDNRAALSIFLPEANRAVAIETIGQCMTEQTIFEWIDSIAEYDDLALELADLPMECFDLYKGRRF